MCPSRSAGALRGQINVPVACKELTIVCHYHFYGVIFRDKVESTKVMNTNFTVLIYTKIIYTFQFDNAEIA